MMDEVTEPLRQSMGVDENDREPGLGAELTVIGGGDLFVAVELLRQFDLDIGERSREAFDGDICDAILRDRICDFRSMRNGMPRNRERAMGDARGYL
jgi:hypothetical protein